MSYTIKEKFEIIDKQINETGKNSLNYVFVADPHID